MTNHRESGNICWGTEEYKRARALWESTLAFSGYDFEYRLATVSIETGWFDEATHTALFSDWTLPFNMPLNWVFQRQLFPRQIKERRHMGARECPLCHPNRPATLSLLKYLTHTNNITIKQMRNQTRLFFLSEKTECLSRLLHPNCHENEFSHYKREVSAILV